MKIVLESLNFRPRLNRNDKLQVRLLLSICRFSYKAANISSLFLFLSYSLCCFSSLRPSTQIHLQSDLLRKKTSNRIIFQKWIISLFPHSSSIFFILSLHFVCVYPFCSDHSVICTTFHVYYLLFY